MRPVSTQEEAIAFINEIKTKHWDATHNVYAYVIRSEGVTRYSDDNEPQGTAGIPVLDAIRKRGITDCVVVVTRYFGGTLLGAGGLVRAYSASAKAGIDAAGECVMTFCSPYASLNAPTLFTARSPSLIAGEPVEPGKADDSVFADDVTVSFHLPTENLSAFNKALSEESSGKLQADETEQRYFAQDQDFRLKIWQEKKDIFPFSFA